MAKRWQSPFLMWLSANFFVLFQFLLQLSCGVMLVPLKHSLHLSDVEVGALVASFYLVYTVLQTPAGMMVDRLGSRRLLAGGGVVCAVGCLMFAQAHTWSVAVVARVIMGMGASFAFVATLNVIERHFKPERFALMVGLIETVGMMGVMLTTVVGVHWLELMSWRRLMRMASVVALGLGVLNCLVIPPMDDQRRQLQSQLSYRAFFKIVWSLFQKPWVWYNGMYCGLMFSVVTVFAGLWVLPFLKLTQNQSSMAIAAEDAMIYVGLAVGAPLMGFLYPRLKYRMIFLSAMALLSACVCAGIILVPPSYWVGCVQFFVLGVFVSAYVLNFSYVNTNVNPMVQSSAVGLTNALSVVTAPLFQTLIGALLPLFSDGRLLLTGDLGVIAYQKSLSVIPLGLVFAAIFAARIRLARAQDGNIVH